MTYFFIRVNGNDQKFTNIPVDHILLEISSDHIAPYHFPRDPQIVRSLDPLQKSKGLHTEKLSGIQPQKTTSVYKQNFNYPIRKSIHIYIYKHTYQL